MPDWLRALVVLLVLSGAMIWQTRDHLAAAIPTDTFRRRCLLWLGLLTAAFVSHSYWIYAAVAVPLVARCAKVDGNRLALFVFVAFVIPPFSATIPGFAGLNQLFEITHPRILSLVLLAPAWWSLRRTPGVEPFGRSFADLCVLGFVLLQLTLQLLVDSPTNTMRYGFYAFMDVFLPYYVASRSLRDLPSWRDAVMSFIYAVALMVPVAVFEFAKHWLLYQSLAGHMGLRWAMGNYLARGDSLRALAATGHSLVLGYSMVVALSLFTYGRRFLQPWPMRAALAALAIGLVVPVSRGPWVGGVAACAVLLLTGADRLPRIARTLLIGGALGVIVLLSPLGQKVIDLLPFVGSVDEYNVTYRQRLFTASMTVIRVHPWFGSYDYLSAPAMQEMIQGEGIIDIVNSYIGIALSSGLVGLGLFVGAFVAAIWCILGGMRHCRPGEEMHDLGRGLLAALAGALVTIATVSSINNIPLIYWLLAGLGVGYGRLVLHAQPAAYSAPGLRAASGWAS